jgi:hypothetical protein
MSWRGPAYLALALCACGGDTGGARVTFHAAAAGPADAVAGQALVFANDAGYEVTLTTARLRIGGVYLNRSVPISGAQAQSCVLPGIYSGQVTTPLVVDVLSPSPQSFAANGDGTADPSHSAEVWIFGTDPFATDDTTPIADVAGTAVKGAASISFTGQITIGQNRATVPPANPALPGQDALCTKRIVRGIGVDFTLAQGGTLLVRVDPRKWFSAVDFAELPPADPLHPDPTQRKFADAPDDSADVNLFSGMHATDAYTFNWQSP